MGLDSNYIIEWGLIGNLGVFYFAFAVDDVPLFLAVRTAIQFSILQVLQLFAFEVVERHAVVSAYGYENHSVLEVGAQYSFGDREFSGIDTGRNNCSQDQPHIFGGLVSHLVCRDPIEHHEQHLTHRDAAIYVVIQGLIHVHTVERVGLRLRLLRLFNIKIRLFRIFKVLLKVALYAFEFEPGPL